MNDDKVTPAHVAIVSPSGEVLNKPPKYGGDGKRTRPSADFMKSLVSREEVIEHMTTAALEVGQKMYDQMSEETAQFLTEMEQAIFDRVMRELEARSWRGRLRQWWFRVRPPKLVVSATGTTAVAEPSDLEVEYAIEEARRREEDRLEDALDEVAKEENGRR